MTSFEKLKIVWGNDMYPSIDPKETLLLDRSATPAIGDVVLFRNRLGIRVAHRLIFRFWGYHFTKADNSPILNFPFKKDSLEGVIAGKRTPVHGSLPGALLLIAFLPYFVLYSKLFDLKKKKHFILLALASRFYPYLPLRQQERR